MKRIALITGATSGIGYAIAEKFAEQKIDLIICGRNQKKLNELTDELRKEIQVQSLTFDVSNSTQVNESLSSLTDEWRNIDILVNCAGNAHGLSSIENGDINDWDMMIDANVKGLLYVSRFVMPLMVARKKGHIINISSVAGKYTYQNGAVYCASKKAVEAISEGMRLDLTQYGIKVTNIAPGAVETNFSVVRFKGDEERAKKIYEGYNPIKPVDVADAIVYAINAPKNVTIADMVLYAGEQAAPTVIYKNN